MKKNILLYIGSILLIVIFSISIFVYVDVFKPSETAALKSLKNGDYYKARTIYTKLFEQSEDEQSRFYWLKGIVSSYELDNELDLAEKALVDYYSEQKKKKEIANYIIDFYSRNSMIENYKKFKDRLVTEKGNKWVSKHISLMAPRSIDVTKEVRNNFTMPIFDLCFAQKSTELRINTDFDDNYSKMVLIAIFSAAKENGLINYDNYKSDTLETKKEKKALYLSEDYFKISVFDVEKHLNIIFYDTDIPLVSQYRYKKAMKKNNTDFFVYKNNVYFKKSLMRNFSLSMPDVDTIIDNFDGSYTIIGNIYSSSQSVEQEFFEYFFDDDREDYLKFNEWKFQNEFVLSLRFNAEIIRMTEHDNEYVYKVKSISVIN